MNTIIKRVVDASERLLFGATAEEAVQRRIALIDQRVEAAFARMLDGLDEDDKTAQSTGYPGYTVQEEGQGSTGE